eukprot:SM005227S17664  [mRNA]  locus=s5227:1:999:- [translate_table: standard]
MDLQWHALGSVEDLQRFGLSQDAGGGGLAPDDGPDALIAHELVHVGGEWGDAALWGGCELLCDSNKLAVGAGAALQLPKPEPADVLAASGGSGGGSGGGELEGGRPWQLQPMATEQSAAAAWTSSGGGGLSGGVCGPLPPLAKAPLAVEAVAGPSSPSLSSHTLLEELQPLPPLASPASTQQQPSSSAVARAAAFRELAAAGWRMEVKVRRHGTNAGHKDHIFTSPSGQVFRSLTSSYEALRCSVPAHAMLDGGGGSGSSSGGRRWMPSLPGPVRKQPAWQDDSSGASGAGEEARRKREEGSRRSRREQARQLRVRATPDCEPPLPSPPPFVA